MVGNKKLKKELGEMPVHHLDKTLDKIEELENDEKKKRKESCPTPIWSPLSPGEIVPTTTITSSDDETSVKKKAGNDSSSSSSDDFTWDFDDESSDDESLNLERSYKDLMSQDNKSFAQLVSISEIAFKLNDLDKIELSVTALQKQATVPAHIWLKYLKARLVVTQTPDERKAFEKKCAKALTYFYNIPLSTFIVNYLVDQGNVENHVLWAKLLADYDVERPDFGDKLRPLLSSITDKKEAATFEELLQKHCVSWNCGEKKRKIIQKLVDEFKKDLDEMKTQNCDWNWSKLHKRNVEDVQSLPFDEDIKNAVIRFLFERTLAKFPIADFLWLCYIDFIMGKDGNKKEEAVAKRESRLGKGFLRSTALDLAWRGVRSRPSVRLNHRFINLMELADFKQPDVDHQLRIILKRIEPDMIMTVELHLDYLAYCVRNTNVKDNAQVIGLRAAFNSVWEELSNLYGDKADTSYEVLQLWAQVEYAHLGSPDNAMHIWHQILGYPGSSHRGLLWLSFAQMESQYNAGHCTPDILRKALSQPVLEDGIKVQEFYRRHERCYGTYESNAACQALELPPEYIKQRFHMKPNSQQVNYRQPQHRQAQPHQAQPRQVKFDQAKPYQEKPHKEKSHKKKSHKEKSHKEKSHKEKSHKDTPDKKNPHQEKPLQGKPHKEKPQQPKPCEEKPQQPKPCEEKPQQPKPCAEKPQQPKPCEEKQQQPKPCEAKPGQQPEENREPLNREQRRKLAHQQKQQQQGHKMSMPKSVSKTTSEDGPPPASEAKLTARPAEETWGSNFKYSPHLEANKIFLKNLHPDCSEEELHELFGPYGTIKDVRLVRKKHMKLKCIAYVEYERPIEAQRAVAARDGYLLKGMNIVAAISNPPPKDSSLDLPKLSLGSKRRVPTSLIPTILLPHAVAEKKRRLMVFESAKFANSTDETNKSEATDQSERKEPAVPKSNKEFRRLFFKDYDARLNAGHLATVAMQLLAHCAHGSFASDQSLSVFAAVLHTRIAQLLLAVRRETLVLGHLVGDAASGHLLLVLLFFWVFCWLFLTLRFLPLLFTIITAYFGLLSIVILVEDLQLGLALCHIQHVLDEAHEFRRVLLQQLQAFTGRQTRKIGGHPSDFARLLLVAASCRHMDIVQLEVLLAEPLGQAQLNLLGLLLLGARLLLLLGVVAAVVLVHKVRVVVGAPLAAPVHCVGQIAVIVLGSLDVAIAHQIRHIIVVLILIVVVIIAKGQDFLAGILLLALLALLAQILQYLALLRIVLLLGTGQLIIVTLAVHFLARIYPKMMGKVTKMKPLKERIDQIETDVMLQKEFTQRFRSSRAKTHSLNMDRNIKVLVGDQGQKEVINLITSEPKDDEVCSGKSRSQEVSPLQEPCDQEKLTVQLAPNDPIHPNSHLNCKKQLGLAASTLKEACDQDTPISQPDADDFLTDPNCVPSQASSSLSQSKSQESTKNIDLGRLRQLNLPGGNKKSFVKEWLSSTGPEERHANPQTQLCSGDIQLLSNSKEWLNSATGLPSSHSLKKSVHQEAIELPCSQTSKEFSTLDSDDEELTGKNPFAKSSTDPQTLQVEDSDAEEAEERMMGFMRRLHFRAAVPESCLTDAVFMVDRPRNAVSLGKKLPTLRLQDNCQEQDLIMISVCKVYSPFQFWFHFVNSSHDTQLLAELNRNINTFYNHEMHESYRIPVTRYFQKAGYICAANHHTGWRRARILVTPPKNADWISIFYVDYASAAQVSPSDLKFLPDWFTDVPPLAARGALSYVHPLGPHWSPDSTLQFRRLVLKRELHAQVTELDADEGILFLRLSQKKTFDQSINKKLVIANLAGKSDHYSRELIEYNCGRRLRYLRERLPSFEILESRLIPLKDEDFEAEFDEIIYSPSFYMDFQLPELHNPFRSGLLKALAAWMPAYRKEQEHWARIYKQANQKVREAQHPAVLGRQEVNLNEQIEKEIGDAKEHVDQIEKREPEDQKK
ncbi:uncharacterized protein LOC108047610 [Drosophila rhopaloa]|uniref:Uncharacterized protein LOC108047610 n=1 Tax=Drosophila rhopaloa TaxID=1041015 RepID=A0A6P4F2W6_DRORH|nr:uncharacterized protein LOC108047610 [Drosophila rhopaloa]